MNEPSRDAGAAGGRPSPGPRLPYRRFFWLLAAAWTLAVAGSMAWSLVHNAQEVRSLTFQTAQALLEKDLLYREWSILHGGVYVPKLSQPSPPSGPSDKERDAVTSLGEQLTLLNPAVVSRQIFDLQDQEMGVRGHITSLRPVRPENRPDAWEREALKAFENGRKEVSGITTEQGQRFFRMMRPLVTVPSCLRCHEEEGRTPGEIRGGISVAVPTNRFETRSENARLAVAHAGLWLIGMAGLVFGVRNLERHSQERQRAEEALQSQYQEKEALLQEIHHRVKNNLQVISSLLQLQLNAIQDPQVLAIFRESQLRIRSMALIHEKLYESDSLVQIDLADYLRSLSKLLFSTYANGTGRLGLDLKLSPIFVSIDVAIPLGLIANELITNCLKFAFPQGRNGTIQVEMERGREDLLRLRVADNGVGLPDGFDIQKSPSLGARLVRMLTSQLDGEAVWETPEEGTSFVLQFRDRPRRKTAGVGRTRPAQNEVGSRASSLPLSDRPSQQPKTETVEGK